MAVMDPFATTTDMEARSQGEITATTHPFLDRELKAATRAIRNACGWHIATSETLTLRRASRHWGEVWVPAMQITAVKITTIDTVEHELTEDEFDPMTGWTSWSGDRYSLEYTAGFEEVPEDLVILTLELAAGALGASLGFAREQAGGVSVTYARAGGGITPADELRIADYKLGRIP